ncbi:LacI family DNA-binding transcriptional regulator [Nocardioides limicola]|uniref:LacI family DNA-binding transcriptional regulator n=1 Tax=Nocardioides limicola TaxID=2803368 RepID=UPI00193B6364|nr:LacI family DNA-binding transcriptional regulator [Nocardioides sp. DJM-14]
MKSKSVRRVTLGDVAARAGVSPTTASYILNGRAGEMRIAGETERRVREAAEELQYRPNRLARNLRTSTTKTYGVISDFVASGHFAGEMLSGAATVARASGHLLVIGETEGDVEVEARLVDEMLDRHVDGILYATLVTMEISVPEVLRKHPTVLMNCVDTTGQLPAVIPDEVGGGRVAGELLLESGRAAGAYVVGADPTPGALAGGRRLTGVEAALNEAGHALAGMIPCEWSVREAFAAMDGWLRDGGRPGALVCMNDRIAMGVSQALAEHGLQVPGDVAIVSFDGSELASWLRPTLTSVAVPYAGIGARAVELLLAGAAGREVEEMPMDVVAGGSLGGGGSTGKR